MKIVVQREKLYMGIAVLWIIFGHSILSYAQSVQVGLWFHEPGTYIVEGKTYDWVYNKKWDAWESPVKFLIAEKDQGKRILKDAHFRNSREKKSRYIFGVDEFHLQAPWMLGLRVHFSEKPDELNFEISRTIISGDTEFVRFQAPHFVLGHLPASKMKTIIKIDGPERWIVLELFFDSSAYHTARPSPTPQPLITPGLQTSSGLSDPPQPGPVEPPQDFSEIPLPGPVSQPTNAVPVPPPTTPTQHSIYVTHLSFLDALVKMPLLDLHTANLLNLAVAQGIQQMRGKYGIIGYNLPNHRIPDTLTNAQKLNEILHHPNMANDEKIRQIAHGLMRQYKIDVLVSGYYIDLVQTVQVRPFIIVKADRKIYTKDLTFTRDEFFCDDPDSPKSMLCQQAQQKIAELVQELLEQL